MVKVIEEKMWEGEGYGGGEEIKLLILMDIMMFTQRIKRI